MGKAKKGKRNANEADVDSEAENVDSVIINENQTKEKLKTDKANDDKKSRKNKNKHNEDDDIDEITRNIEDIDISKKKKGKSVGKKHDSGDETEEVDSKKKSKTKKGKKQASSDEDDDDTAPTKVSSNKSKSKGGFDVLQVEDDVENRYESDNEDVSSQNTKKNSNKTESESKKETGKKSKKKKKRDDSDDEDIEKVLQELALEYSGGKKEVEPTPEREEEVQDVAEKKKEKKKKVVESPIESKKDDDDEEITGTVKTAAQKKKEKKEREKAKKMSEKQKPGVKKQDSAESEVKVSEDKAENDDSVKDDEPIKDKKKKKGAKEEEKKGKAGKGPDKKTIAAMQEALKKLKEEEERHKREEEERIKREEEAELARLEQERLEQERKEKRKQKEKERKERRKAEGKLLTPKQKLERERALALLEERRKQLLLLQGGESIPEEPVEAKKPRSGTRIRPNKLKKDSSQEKSVEEQKPPEDANKEPERQSSQEADVKKEDDVKDSWDAESSEDDEPQSPKDQKVEIKIENTVEAKKNEDDDNEGSSEGDSDEEESSDESDSEEESADEQQKRSDAEKKRAKALARIQKRREDAEKSRTVDDLRAAVVCVLGHVDTGKTKILDKLRRTNVQDGEAGGITQQIGATNVPIENIKEQTKIVKGFADKDLKLPGLLIIDTPGHESFSNLRNRGSSLCDIAILVVDIMHGLEPQTIESINLLKQKRTPFIVALNKIDRLYDWETMNRKDVRDILKTQASHTQLEFENRMKEVILQFAEQGLNAALFFENPDPKTYISLVPTSAVTGEGMGNLLALIVEMCQTHLAKRLMYSAELQATVLEVKAISGLGTTIDVILVNGILKEGDTMILAGTDGPVVTQIRSLLMPQPMRELRVKNAYIEHREVRAAQGVKIAAKELEKAIAGLNLVVAHHPDEVDVLREEVAKELKSALSSIKLQERGVFVQASTLGSLEALLDFLRTSKIPYAGIRIGPVVKKDVMKASIMLEHDSQYATILAFDVKIERDAQELADSLGVKIFQADIIYHLFDKFTAYRDELKQRKRDEFKNIAVFPCKLRVLPHFVFNSRDPIVCGVMVEAGIVKEGTPICVPSQEFVELGIVTSIESNHKTVESARKGQEVCIKIEPIPGEAPKMFGRHFDEKDMLISKISRQSIDACKDYFRDDLIKTDWQLMVELKKMFQIL